jgi:hypothetical protein
MFKKLKPLKREVKKLKKKVLERLCAANEAADTPA